MAMYMRSLPEAPATLAAPPAPPPPPAPVAADAGARAAAAAALSGAALLAACGGASELPAGFERRAQARTDKTVLGVAAVPAPAAASAAPAAPGVPMASAAPGDVPTASALMDWAERVYSGFFPEHQADQVWAPYTYRLYSNGNAVGVAEGRVYVLGPLVGQSEVPVDVGSLVEFGPLVGASRWAYDDLQAARFLGHATLGATDADIVAVRALGYEAWLALQFAAAPSSGNWDWLVARGVDKDPDAANVAKFVDSQVWQRLIAAPDSLRQRVALALSEVFVVGFDGISGPWKQFKLAAYWDLLASHAFGNFRTLLEAVTLSPAMGNYLNTVGNQKEDPATGRLPDENYAREVMQLFTIGLHELGADGSQRLDAAGNPVETYTQDMVTQLARVFTGWNYDGARSSGNPELMRRPLVLNAAQHSTLAVSFLGTTIAAGTDGKAALTQALDTLFAHANVGPFIGRQLIQRLTTSNPSPGYVSRVAAAFANNGAGVRGDLAAVVKAVLLDDEARSHVGLGHSDFGKLREPLLRLLQWARSFKASSRTGDWNLGNLSDPSTRLGQSPQRSPSVFNWFRPGYVPAGTAMATDGLVAPEFQIANETSVAGWLNFMLSMSSARHADVLPDYTSELALAGDPAALVARVEKLLCAGQLQADARQLVVDAVASIANTGSGPTNRVYTAVMLVMAAPDYLVQR